MEKIEKYWWLIILLSLGLGYFWYKGKQKELSGLRNKSVDVPIVDEKPAVEPRPKPIPRPRPKPIIDDFAIEAQKPPVNPGFGLASEAKNNPIVMRKEERPIVEINREDEKKTIRFAKKIKSVYV